jgi:hypothetical protein
MAAARTQEAAVEEDTGRPISYLALENGTPVLTTSGAEIGTVEHVLQIPDLDLFDGIVVNTSHYGVRFVDRDQIGDIFTKAVHTTVADDEVASLAEPKGTLAVRPDLAHDEGHSLHAWWGRHFGREHWKDI